MNHSAELSSTTHRLYSVWIKMTEDSFASSTANMIIESPYIRLHVRGDTNQIHWRYDDA